MTVMIEDLSLPFPAPPFYRARLVGDVHGEPMTDWLRTRLAAVGTNRQYVLDDLHASCWQEMGKHIYLQPSYRLAVRALCAVGWKE